MGDDPSVGTPAWREGLAARLAALPPAGGRRVALGQIVTAPDGERAWTVLAGGNEPAEVHEGVGSAEVCLVTDLETAARLAAGASAAALLGEGLVKVRGDAAALAEGHEALASLGAALQGGGAGGGPR